MTTPDLMTPGQVAARFGVDPHTVTRWANAGRLPAVRTPGGHRRYRRADVEALATPGADLTETRPRPHLTETPDPTTTPTPTEPHHDVRERAGRALYEHRQAAEAAPQDGYTAWDDLPEEWQDEYREAADAALAAAGLLADPTARTEVEWGVACPLDDDVIPTADPDWSVRHHDRNCGPGHRLVRRTVTDWTPAEEDDR